MESQEWDPLSLWLTLTAIYSEGLAAPHDRICAAVYMLYIKAPSCRKLSGKETHMKNSGPCRITVHCETKRMKSSERTAKRKQKPAISLPRIAALRSNVTLG